MAAEYGINALNWSSISEQTVRASNAGTLDQFGRCVAISGNYAIVGAWQEDGTNNNTGIDSGAAYIFELSGGVWNQKQMLIASNFGAGDTFGSSVAISGNYAIVGAQYEDGSSNNIANCGAAYIFELSGGVWNQTAVLRASNIGGNVITFGNAVAISGNYAIVGATYEDGSSNNIVNCGAVYIFERTGAVWSQTALIRASNLGESDGFGSSVAISGDYAIVGAPYEDGTDATTDNCGAAYIIERSGGIWSQTRLIRASNRGVSDQFGWSVAISGTYAIVSAIFEDGNSEQFTNTGAAYIFERETNGDWNQTSILRANNADNNDQFGQSVAIDGNYAIVGSNWEDGSNNNIGDGGAAYIFERNNAGGWAQIKILRASNIAATHQFGFSVAISGNNAIVGAPWEDGVFNVIPDGGAAYIYYASSIINPTPLTFNGNTLTISNDINPTDTDTVSFSLTSGAKLYPFVVNTFTGTGTITYTLQISGGAIVVSGTFTTTGVNLLNGNVLTAAGNTTYILTLTASAAITYTIVGSLLTAPTNILLSTTAINELKPIGTTISTITCDNPNNAFITYSVSDTTNFNITGSTLKTNAFFDFEKVSSYTITITASIGGLTSSNTITISTINVSNEASEIRNQNLQGLELKTAAASQSNPPITASELKAAGYTATELKAANYTILNLKVAGYTTIEMAAAGYTQQQIDEVMSWAEDSTANRLNASYIEGYLDISGGNVTVRGSSRSLIMKSGNARFSGTTTFTQPYIYNSDITLNNRLFVIGDVSMGSGNANITGNISINGTLSAGSYNTGTIALNAIYPAFASNMTYSQKIQMNGDVSMNGNTQFSGSTTLRIGNQIQFSDGTIIRTTNREANGTTFKASNFNNMTVVGAFASNPVLTPSDYRIKTNVQNLDETHVLDNLRPVKYYQTQSERNDIGFLAHELQEYYPDLVEGEMDGEQMQSVNYNGILAILINEVKRLKQNIKQTKAAFAAKKASI